MLKKTFLPSVGKLDEVRGEKQVPSNSVPRKPEGQATRGKTTHNRLRRVDNFLLQYDSTLLSRSDGPYDRAFYVDLGFGAKPVTTLESAARLRRLNPRLPVLGVEIDPERVAKAQPYADALTFFRLGGFNLPLQKWPDGQPETVRLIRAFNVLRQYEESAVAQAYERLAHYVLPGGLLIEGTSDPFGRIWAANLLRREDEPLWQVEALVFSINFRVGFDPGQLQTVLPKNYIHRMVPGEAIYDFFAAWKSAAQETQAYKGWGLRQWFGASAHNLAARGYLINLRRKWLWQGWLIWRFN
ncbi:MAG: methylase [Anaerolineae bacterium]|nr:methylase [Anaerolineae bacterium]